MPVPVPPNPISPTSTRPATPFWRQWYVLGVAVAIALTTWGLDIYKLPSGSMTPTLEVDALVVGTSFSYGLRLPFTQAPVARWATPARGDLVTFVHHDPGGPEHGELYIKRVVAVGGDTVRLEDGAVVLNGQPITSGGGEELECPIDGRRGDLVVQRCSCIRKREEVDGSAWTIQVFRATEAPDAPDAQCFHMSDWPSVDPLAETAWLGAPASHPRWPDIEVPPDHVFLLGDNRDRSQDSRYFGFVPIERVTGRVLGSL